MQRVYIGMTLQKLMYLVLEHLSADIKHIFEVNICKLQNNQNSTELLKINLSL